MGSLPVKPLIAVLSTLGHRLIKSDPALLNLASKAAAYNPWFTPDNVEAALTALGRMLNRIDLEKWLTPYESRLQQERPVKTIGLILAGNVPMVGFHDLLCVLVSGHRAMVKLSSQDPELIPFLIAQLEELEPALKARTNFTNRLTDFDAVIATGSNNSSRYFDYYFSKYPHIIRNNRNSVAVLSGKESKEQLERLGKDIFSYFGLGCRNISKLYIPEGYDYAQLYDSLESYNYIIDNFRYSNNYDYNKTILLLNHIPHYDNRFLLITENESLASPMASLHAETYHTIAELEKKLKMQENKIQCIASEMALSMPAVPFGKTQEPYLWDYADGVDTMDFLLSLS